MHRVTSYWNCRQRRTVVYGRHPAELCSKPACLRSPDLLCHELPLNRVSARSVHRKHRRTAPAGCNEPIFNGTVRLLLPLTPAASSHLQNARPINLMVRGPPHHETRLCVCFQPLFSHVRFQKMLSPLSVSEFLLFFFIYFFTLQ